MNTTASTIASPEVHPVQAALRFLRAVRYRKGVMVVALVTSCLLGGLYYVTTPRIYESKAALLFQRVEEEGVDSTEMAGSRVARESMVTFKNTLCSKVVLEDALDKLPAANRTHLAEVPREKWVEFIQQNLQVTIVRNSTILRIAYASQNPEEANAVVQSLIRSYLDFINKLTWMAGDELRSILNTEVVEVQKAIQDAEVELIEAHRGAGELEIRDDEKGVSVVSKRVLDAQEAWQEASKNRQDAQSRLIAIQEATRSGADLVEFALTIADSMGGERFLQRLRLTPPDPTTIASIRKQLIENRAKLQELLESYGPAHSEVRKIEGQIRATEQLLQNLHQMEHAQLHRVTNEEMARLLWEAAGQQLRLAVAREELALASLQQAEQGARKLDGAKMKLRLADAKWNRLNTYYEQLMNRLKAVDLRNKAGTLRTEVIERPEIPEDAVWPRLPVVGLLSILVGLGAGLGLVYLQDLLDDRFRSPDELQMHLGLPILSTVPKLMPLPYQGMDAVHVHVQPNAAETEAFRNLRTALALSEDSLRHVVVSSGEPGDGKTTVVVNLATTYAQSGKRTLLIDADMRRPGLTPLLDLKGQRGLSTVLRADAPISESAEANLRRSMAENLDVLPVGPRPINPAELLAGDRFSELLSWAETRYDQIVIDSPPTMISDTAIIGRLVDGVLLIVQPEKNRRRAVIRAAEGLLGLGVKVLGVVINRVAPEKGRDYYSYGEGYGYAYGYGYGYGRDEHAAEEQDGRDDEPVPVIPHRRKVA